jgi:hypothetical protein
MPGLMPGGVGLPGRAKNDDRHPNRATSSTTTPAITIEAAGAEDAMPMTVSWATLIASGSSLAAGAGVIFRGRNGQS